MVRKAKPRDLSDIQSRYDGDEIATNSNSEPSPTNPDLVEHDMIVIHDMLEARTYEVYNSDDEDDIVDTMTESDGVQEDFQEFADSWK